MPDRPPADAHALPARAPSGRTSPGSYPPARPSWDQLALSVRLARDAGTGVPGLHLVPVGPGPAIARPVASLWPDSVNDPAIARAKITPAPVREATLARERLLGWLAENIRHRLIAVVADTGYGKTTLLADFTRRAEIRCLWYRLDAADRDWVAFLNYLVAAGREYVPDFGEATLQLLQGIGTTDPPLERVLATFIAELDALGSERTVLILDDYHLVDTDPEIRTILTRLVADSPAGLSFVLLSRRRPRLAIGRLAAQGAVAELGTEELRFSPGETEQLFRDTYHLPLDEDTLTQVEARTEGWAASLQMLRSSLQGRSPEAIGRFVGTLTGAEGRLYEYLAEEVMAELEPALQRFLALTSILETVTPDLVGAIYAADPLHPGDEVVERWTREAHQEGLMARRDAVGSGERYHPLFRDLLSRHLKQIASGQEIRAMHVRVARAAEDTDWLVSSRHYIRGGSESDAIRVLSANVTHALGSGQWGEAAELIHEVRAPDDDPRLAVILAREDIYRGRLEDGLARLERFDLSLLDGPTRALLVQARIHALWWLGRTDELGPDVARITKDPTIPERARDIARAILVTAASTTTGRLDEASEVLKMLAETQQRAGHHFYAGVSRHNLLFVLLNRGHYDAAVREGEAALEQFASAPGIAEEAYSVHFGIARSLCEAGRFVEGQAALDRAIAGTSMGAVEQWFETAGQLAILGRATDGERLLRRAELAVTSGVAQNVAAGALSRARLLTSLGRPEEVPTVLGPTYKHLPAASTCSWLAWMEVAALAALAGHDPDGAGSWIEQGTALAHLQKSGLFQGRFRLLVSLVGGGSVAVDAAIERASDMDLMVAAEALVASLHLTHRPHARVVSLIQGWPQKWLPLLRRALENPVSDATEPAALLLDEFGDLVDVPILRRLVRSRAKGQRGSSIGRGLARRRSPHLCVHDLGRSRLEIGDRIVELASIRRRAAAILCFLLTRRGYAAPRDQVLETFWPELDPQSAANSLNQTLYFLRREIDPGFVEDVSVPYVRFDGDLLWLDGELVHSDSAGFHQSVSQGAKSAGSSVDSLVRTFEMYEGRFAPEFEYDEWSSSWRELLHAEYLQTAETLMARLVATGRTGEAVAVATGTLATDPDADRIELQLIRLYGASGSDAAAAEQYGHYASTQRGEYGVEPPSLDEILRSPGL